MKGTATKMEKAKSIRRRILDAALRAGMLPLVEAGIAAKYVAKNYNNRRKSILKSPYVCRFPDFNPQGSLDYIDEEVGDYFRNSSLRPSDLRGQRILEIGPGENLGVGLQLLLLGARKVVSIDRFRSLRPPGDQVRLYQAMAERLPPESRGEFESLIRIRESGYELNPDRYEYRADTPLETFPDKLGSDARFDLILSRAVLEHLYDPGKAMEAMDRLLAPGGRMIHEVDFRDHGMYTYLGLNPLTFLTVPDAAWSSMSSHLGAPNRWLSSSFETKLKAMGYEYGRVVKHLLYEERFIGKPALTRGVDYGQEQEAVVEGIRDRLLHRYRSLPLEELLTSVIVFTARKPARLDG